MARLFWLSDARWALIEAHVPRNSLERGLSLTGV